MRKSRLLFLCLLAGQLSNPGTLPGQDRGSRPFYLPPEPRPLFFNSATAALSNIDRMPILKPDFSQLAKMPVLKIDCVGRFPMPQLPLPVPQPHHLEPQKPAIKPNR